MVVFLFAGLLLAGCGLGPGEDTGNANLLVTRDYGREVILEEPDLPVNESSNAMRILDESADLETAYGGEYVQAVDGLAGGNSGGRSFDWFFAVNGIVAERGSAQFPVAGGDRVWWDYRDWTDAMEVGAVVGSYPAPFTTGYDNRDWGTEVECLDSDEACDLVEKQLLDEGVSLESREENMLIRVGTIGPISETPEGRRILNGPGSSGVFARFSESTGGGPESPWHLFGLTEEGETGIDYGTGSGLVAALRNGENPPVWIITGGTDRAVGLAAAALDPKYLERRYAAVVSGRQVSSLPLVGGQQ
jgi:hypothetical protein